MAGLLAGCGSVTVAYEPVTLNSVQFTSNWFVESNGNRQYIICNDRETTVFMDVRWTGPLARLDARFEGQNTTANNTTRTTGYFAPDYSGARQFTYTFGAGMAPQSLTKGQNAALSAQAIVVNPVNRGTTFLTVTGYNPDGVPSNTIQLPQGIPVYTCG
ncbi:hypothetical protein GCM10008955_27690 [Deinococcus malanensis]|uniref:Lipoprotein n=2 Tax=Deinococcus malanensis TaxID=1706855 RepID=A0ABQ2F1H0_9DEIO|nr:hypothetical protein GCM10008955_27690 [Deinococcus malanensis]